MENLDKTKIKIERGKEKLLALEKEGIYVFHGTIAVLDELEPKQGRDFDYKLRKMINDGTPAVVATPFAEIAIFRAIINKKIKAEKGKCWSRFSNDDGKLEFATTPEAMELAKKVKGYVYVFKKESFEWHNSIEWRSAHKVKPVRIFEVNFEDLPADIKLEAAPRDLKI